MANANHYHFNLQQAPAPELPLDARVRALEARNEQLEARVQHLEARQAPIQVEAPPVQVEAPPIQEEVPSGQGLKWTLGEDNILLEAFLNRVEPWSRKGCRPTYDSLKAPNTVPGRSANSMKDRLNNHILRRLQDYRVRETKDGNFLEQAKTLLKSKEVTDTLCKRHNRSRLVHG